MKYIFRGNVIFEYIPHTKDTSRWQEYVVLCKMEGGTVWDYCRMVPEDYKLLSEFFDKVYRHIQGEDIELKDIKVN